MVQELVCNGVTLLVPARNVALSSNVSLVDQLS